MRPYAWVAGALLLAAHRSVAAQQPSYTRRCEIGSREDYHRPTDDVAKLDIEKITNVSKLSIRGAVDGRRRSGQARVGRDRAADALVGDAEAVIRARRNRLVRRFPVDRV